MFLSFLTLLFLLLVIMGFARVVRYFWDWLRGGEKVDEDSVRTESAAEEHAEEVADRELAGFEAEDRPEQVKTVVRASSDVIGAYLDEMKLGWFQVAIIFFVGCIAGLLIEEIWMLITAGLTENRVGLVWGPFSPLYGFGSVFLTVVSFELRKHGAKNWQVFLAAALIGGLLEQITGWSMETLFNATSWSYSHLPDHITKWVAWRFLVFWGLLGLVWCRAVMPVLLYRIGMLTSKRQLVFVVLLSVYLVADIVMTMACFNRKTARDEGVPAQNAFEEWVDENYTDEFIANRFQNLVIGDSQ